MKEIFAQRSSHILTNLIPLSALDYSFIKLTSSESNELFELWKTAKNGPKCEVIVPLSYNRLTLVSLKEKGYIQVDGMKVTFTGLGTDAIKKLILNEENSLKKG